MGHARIDGRGRLWAAALATTGVVSHRSAAWVWELAFAPSSRIEVTTRGASRSIAAIRVYRSQLTTEDITHHDGLPVTTVARTLVDLADVLTPHRLERVCHRAEHLRLLDVKAIDAVLRRSPGRRSRDLRAALATLSGDAVVTRSELEERFLALIGQFGLPRPRVNARVEGLEVDFFWPERRLIIETDGAATHATRTAFERDRARDLHLKARGYEVVRVTHRMLANDAAAIVALLRSQESPRQQRHPRPP